MARLLSVPFISIFLNASFLFIYFFSWMLPYWFWPHVYGSHFHLVQIQTIQIKKHNEQKEEKKDRKQQVYMWPCSQCAKKQLWYSHHQLLRGYIYFTTIINFVFHLMNLNPGNSDKGVKQINRSHRGVESTGMSIKFMFWHFKKNGCHFSFTWHSRSIGTVYAISF